MPAHWQIQDFEKGGYSVREERQKAVFVDQITDHKKKKRKKELHVSASTGTVSQAWLYYTSMLHTGWSSTRCKSWGWHGQHSSHLHRYSAVVRRSWSPVTLVYMELIYHPMALTMEQN